MVLCTFSFAHTKSLSLNLFFVSQITDHVFVVSSGHTSYFFQDHHIGALISQGYRRALHHGSPLFTFPTQIHLCHS